MLIGLRRSCRGPVVGGPGLLVAAAIVAWAALAPAQTLPPKFRETVVYSGLAGPTAVRFLPDGRVLVAEKRGVVKLFGGLQAAAPVVLVDLRTNVFNGLDRGLLGLAVHPRFADDKPYIYLLYAHDADIGGKAPKWGEAGQSRDLCPDPPGATKRPGGCLISGRLSRFRVDGDQAAAEEVLLEDWFQQYPSHAPGGLVFGTDGYLYASAGDGANYDAVDWGQYGSPGESSSLFPDDPEGEGGALRSQDLYRPADATGLSGTVIRVDPDTGAAAADNPLVGAADENAARIVAYGLRNPFRLTVRPGTTELWIADVGWETWEEINLLADPSLAVANFGWPCFEGPTRQPKYDAEDLSLCEALYAEEGRAPGTVTAPVLAYHHEAQLVVDDECGQGPSAVGGLAFYGGGDYPSGYDGALFFSDYARRCIWVAFPGADGRPDMGTTAPFVTKAAAPVDLQVGPGGDLFYVDIHGTVRRVEYFVDNKPPQALFTAQPTRGAPPLTVVFSAAQSFDPDLGDSLSYAWDLDGDGAFDDASTASASYTYEAPGEVEVRLRVSDAQHRSHVVSQTIKVAPTIDVALSVAGEADQTVPGAPVRLVVTVANNGPSLLAELTLHLELPAALAAPAFKASTGLFEVATHHWTGLDLAAGQNARLLISGTVAPDVVDPLQLAASVVLDGLDDPDPTNDSWVGPIPLTPKADLLVEQQLDLDTVLSGQDLGLEIAVTNRGPSSARDVAVTLPTALSLLQVAGDGWACSSSAGPSGARQCKRALLGPAERSSIRVTVSTDVPPGIVALTAAVSAATADPTPGNDTASASVGVESATGTGQNGGQLQQPEGGGCSHVNPQPTSAAGALAVLWICWAFSRRRRVRASRRPSRAPRPG